MVPLATRGKLVPATLIAMFLVTSPIVINVPTRGLLAVETMHAIVRWLANLNIKSNMTSMSVIKKHRYSIKRTVSKAMQQHKSFVQQTSVLTKETPIYPSLGQYFLSGKKKKRYVPEIFNNSNSN